MMKKKFTVEYRSLRDNPRRFAKREDACEKEVKSHERKFHQGGGQIYRWDLKDGGKTANWMEGAVKKPGALHRALNVPMDKKISHSKLEQASHSKSPLMRKRANLALTFSKYRNEK